MVDVSEKSALLAIQKADQAGYDRGYKEGLQNTRETALGFLEQQYMAADAPARGTPHAEAILQMARELSELLR